MDSPPSPPSLPHLQPSCRPNRVEGFLGSDVGVSLTDIVDPRGLQSALLSTFVWQPSFVCKIFPASASLTVICPSWGSVRETARDKPLKAIFPWCTTHSKLAVRLSGENAEEDIMDCGCNLADVRLLRLIHPPFPGIEGGIVHPKMMLLRYAAEGSATGDAGAPQRQWLRLVVSSGNMHREDWEEYGEVCWWGDFPLREKPLASADIPSSDTFGNDLALFLREMGCEEELLSTFVASVDFTLCPAHLIASIPGHLPLDDRSVALEYGHLKLRRVLEKNCRGWEWKGAPVVAQVSTIGASGIHWYEDVMHSFCPEKEERSYRRNREEQEPEENNRANSLAHLKIIYPSDNFIASLPEKMQEFKNHNAYWDARRVARPCLHEIPTRPFVENARPFIWHSKVYSRILPPSDTPCGHQHGWVYIGSHNLSAAAWGNVNKVRTHMKMSNYEAGLLFLSPPCGVEPAEGRGAVRDLAVLGKYLSYELTHNCSTISMFATADRPCLGSAHQIADLSFAISGTCTKWKEAQRGAGFGFARGTLEPAYAEHLKKLEKEKEGAQAREREVRGAEEGDEGSPETPKKKEIYQPKRGRGAPVDVYIGGDVLLRSGFSASVPEGATVNLEAIEQGGDRGWKCTWVLSVDTSTAHAAPAPAGRGAAAPAGKSQRRDTPAPRGWERNAERFARDGGDEWTTVGKSKPRRDNAREGNRDNQDSGPRRAETDDRDGYGGRKREDRGDRGGGRGRGRAWGGRQGSAGIGREGNRYNTGGDSWRAAPSAAGGRGAGKSD